MPFSAEKVHRAAFMHQRRRPKRCANAGGQGTDGDDSRNAGLGSIDHDAHRQLPEHAGGTRPIDLGMEAGTGNHMDLVDDLRIVPVPRAGIGTGTNGSSDRPRAGNPRGGEANLPKIFEKKDIGPLQSRSHGIGWNCLLCPAVK